MTHGVPTTGPRGVRFRSRLEARWAAFFDALRWPWQYEPDLGLDGWIPDFAIISGAGLLVEVKPVVRVADFDQHRARIERSRVVAPVLIVGAALFFEDASYTPPAPYRIGLRGWCGGFDTWTWELAALDNVALDDVGAAVPTPKAAQRAWVRAGNELQWRRG